ncbi:MAG: diguanylate cyclase [Pseudomonadota bacterium]
MMITRAKADPLSVLMVDDSPDNLNLLKQVLGNEGYELRVAPSGSFALRAIHINPPDLILLDIRMPDMDGMEVCRQLKNDDLTRDIPIIFLTALNSSLDEGRGLKLGAIDYITKPFNADIVKARVRNHLNYVHQRQLLEQLAKLDPLTEIPNRRWFDDAIESEWYRAMRAEIFISVAILDIDYFKQYNDNQGHLAGDQALIKVAQAIVKSLSRPADLVARYGGEEFVVLLPNTDSNGAKQFLDQIRNNVEKLNLVYELESEEKHLTISVGGSTVIPHSDVTFKGLLEAADANLYQAKNTGRNQVVWQELPSV